MRLSKIYTKKGDGGTTQLATAETVRKDCIRIEAYGSVDELNSFMGLWADTLAQIDAAELVAQIIEVQHRLFDIGGELSFPPGKYDEKTYGGVSEENITQLEAEIDTWNSELAPLKNFVLPGGHLGNSTAHVCRTICRRSERLVVTLASEEAVRSEIIKYLNRLSDWLFVASRHVSKLTNTEEILWGQKRKNKQP